MNPPIRQDPPSEPAAEAASIDLESRYARIGLPAVAAATRYPSEARNPACKPAVFASRALQDVVD